jgi:hypothetical protein
MALHGLAPDFDTAVDAIAAKRSVADPMPAYRGFGRAFVETVKKQGAAVATFAKARDSVATP